jgi:hypothetical protein
MTTTPATIEIGQDVQFVKDGEALLVTDGAILLQYYIDTIPVVGAFLALPIINNITGMVINAAVGYIIKELDLAGYAIYVAFKTQKQVSDYIAAKASGNQSTIDNAGDAAIHLGGI